MVGEVSVGYLLIGAAAIVIANVGLYFEMESHSERASERPAEVDVNELIAKGESSTVEFKSSLRRNLHTNQNDRIVELAVLKTVAAFLNSRDGGTLIIGVSDDHKPVGIEVDAFKNEDRMGLHLSPNRPKEGVGSVS